MPLARTCRYPTGAALVVGAALLVAACGGGGGGNGAQAGGTAQAPAETSTGGLPPRLARNVEQADQIVGEGREAFQQRLRALSGHPVVVNQWASWCTSCRFEFPFFAEAVKRHRAKVAFLGLDSQDERGNAEAFLEEFPVGFPSIFDPDAEVAAAYGGGRAWPTTMFFDAEGELVNVKIGAYATAELLEQDIRRWALDQGS
jgi:cytochrome c biogenesis protein CcmG, thiol:disulfide interchange protein DsbE